MTFDILKIHHTVSGGNVLNENKIDLWRLSHSNFRPHKRAFEDKLFLLLVVLNFFKHFENTNIVFRVLTPSTCKRPLLNRSKQYLISNFAIIFRYQILISMCWPLRNVLSFSCAQRYSVLFHKLFWSRARLDGTYVIIGTRFGFNCTKFWIPDRLTFWFSSDNACCSRADSTVLDTSFAFHRIEFLIMSHYPGYGLRRFESFSWL